MTASPAPVFSLNSEALEANGLVFCIEYILKHYDLNGSGMIKVSLFKNEFLLLFSSSWCWIAMY